MDTGKMIVLTIIVGIFALGQLASCSQCYQDGGTPVRGVVGYECMRK